MKKLFYYTFFFFSLSANISAQENLTLSDAIQKGLENNYQVQIAKRNIEIAENNNTWNAAGRYPTINLTLGNNNTFTGQNNPASFLQKFNSLGTGLTAGAEASYTLFDGYTVRINKKRFEAIQKQNQGNEQIAIENTIEQIINTYNQALIQKEALKSLEELLKISRDRIEYQAIRQEYGQAGKFDLLQSEDAYFNDSTSYLIQLNSYDLALRQLNVAMGEDDVNVQYNLTDQLSYSPQTYNFEDLQTKMFDTNNNLKNLYVGLSLSNIEKEAAESFKYPVIRAVGGLGLGGTLSGLNVLEGPPNLMIDSPLAQSNYNAYINLSASYNLYNGGNTKRNIENTEIQEKIAQLNIQDLKRNLSAQLSNTLATYDNQRNLLALTDQRLENARENLSIAETRFRSAQINSFDYRTIQLNYLNAVQSQLQAIFNLKNTETTLMKLTGGLVR